MYFWNSYPFVRFTIALVLGIVLFDHVSDLWRYPMATCGILLTGYLISVIVSNRSSFYKLRHVNGLLALLILAFIGGYLTKSKYHSYNKNHYRNIDTYIKGFSGTISSSTNERTNHFRYTVELGVVEGDSIRKTSGKIYLYIKKDSLTNAPLKFGDRILAKGSFFPIPKPGNPKEFNYKKYLARQGIYSHSFVERSQIKVLENDPPNQLLSWAYSLRLKANDIIDTYIPEKRENAIGKALLLGIKDSLDNDIKQAYASAGAMHVLAVSGLHVGIVYLILHILLGKLREKGNTWRSIFGLISVLFIWFYAIVTGLSPSVMRAATMFSLVALGDAISKEGNIYNTLGFAAFILLIYDPYLMYSVGFQLSFAAVFGIVYLQPKLYQLIESRFLLLDKVWEITCVSIAAQLSTFPLSAYYFHQFPTYFLISNLVVIPGAFVMLILGISMLTLDPILGFLGQLLGRILFHVMWLVNEVIEQIEKLPYSPIEWIYMDQVNLLFTYIIVMVSLAVVHFSSFKTLVLCCLCILMLTGFNLFAHHNQSKEEKLILYKIKDRTAIDYVMGHHANLYMDGPIQDLELFSFQVNPYRLSSYLPPIAESTTSLEMQLTKGNEIKYGIIGGLKIMTIDSTTFHLEFQKKIQTDILIVNNEAVKNLNWLIQHFEVEYLVIGNKNSYYYSRKMKNQAKELDIKLHSLKEDGALILNLKKHKKRADY